MEYSAQARQIHVLSGTLDPDEVIHRLRPIGNDLIVLSGTETRPIGNASFVLSGTETRPIGNNGILYHIDLVKPFPSRILLNFLN